MSTVLSRERILEILPDLDLIPMIEEGFAAYSRGEAVIPPVGELLFDDPPGELHIKYGYLKSGRHAVVKIASGFYQNPKLGLPAGDGLMLLFDRTTGRLQALLLDEGLLTDIRTAAAGAVAARHLAPSQVNGIGVFGAGIQGRLQVEYLAGITPCRTVRVWGVQDEELERYRLDMEAKGYQVTTTRDPESITAQCNIILTATPSRVPLIRADWIRPGTHITAMGSDTPDKQELDPHILAKADIVVTDSLPQSQARGEVFKAREAGLLTDADVRELGAVISDPALRRQNDSQITVADLTGVAVQDLQIASAVYAKAG